MESDLFFPMKNKQGEVVLGQRFCPLPVPSPLLQANKAPNAVSLPAPFIVLRIQINFYLGSCCAFHATSSPCRLKYLTAK